MADDDIVKEVSAFFLNTCQPQHRLDFNRVTDLWSCLCFYDRRSSDRTVALLSGSNAEFYIEPQISCISDYDTMFHYSFELAILEGRQPPTQLPAEFDRSVRVYEIVDSEFPGYVYLIHYGTMVETADNGKYQYMAVEQPHGRIFKSYKSLLDKIGDKMHGPACPTYLLCGSDLSFIFGEANEKYFYVDHVPCMRCLSWPSQAADWPTRHRKYEWPDSATVNRVLVNGCDVVYVAHRQCKQDERLCHTQYRLSFSRAEIQLINSWIQEQQIVYHMLRYFLKTEVTDCAKLNKQSETDMPTLRTYHIKTLMLWACELKPKSWWTELTVVEICVYLLKVLGVWLRDGRCKHYFISNCNLLGPDRVDDVTAVKLMSVKEVPLAKWFIDNYIRKCYPVNHLSYDDFVKSPQNASSAVAAWRSDNSVKLAYTNFLRAQYQMLVVQSSSRCLSVRMCIHVISETSKSDQRLLIYFAAVQFLRVAVETSSGSLTEEQLHMMRALCYHVIQTLPTDEILESFRELLRTFASVEIHVSGIRCTSCRCDRLLRLLGYQARPAIVCQLETSELVELLQQYAVEYLTISRQIEARDFGSLMPVGTVVYKALYAYKLGNYRHCLQLCKQNLHVLFSRDFVDLTSFIVSKVFIELLDDDIISLFALIQVADPSNSYVKNPYTFHITERCLLLHLMAQCHMKMKLHYSKTSLIKIFMLLNCDEVSSENPARKQMTLNQLMLKLTKKKILHCVKPVDTQTISEPYVNSSMMYSHFPCVLAYILFIFFLYFIVRAGFRHRPTRLWPRAPRY